VKPAVLFAAFALSAASFSQDIDLEQLKQLGTPGPMHELIGKMLGDWTVDVTYKFGDGPEGKSKADCHCDWVMDGHYLRKTYSSKMSGVPFTVEQTVGYDNFRKEFFEWQIESDNTSRIETKGQLMPDGKAISCTGPTLDPLTMKPAKLRTVTRFVDGDTYTTEWYIQVGDKPESKQVTLVHHRKTSG
jgi:Protein of unknown function (DUF1579)